MGLLLRRNNAPRHIIRLVHWLAFAGAQAFRPQGVNNTAQPQFASLDPRHLAVVGTRAPGDAADVVSAGKRRRCQGLLVQHVAGARIKNHVADRLGWQSLQPAVVNRRQGAFDQEVQVAPAVSSNPGRGPFGCRPLSGFQCGNDPLGHRPCDARHADEVVDGRLP